MGVAVGVPITKVAAIHLSLACGSYITSVLL
jgi:hypothetical protein